MRTRALLAWLVLGAIGLALAGEPQPPPPPAPPPPGMPGAEPRRQMMPPHPGMIPGVPPELIQFWREADPDFLNDLRERAQAHPEQRGPLLRRAFLAMQQLQQLRERDSEAFELQILGRKLERSVRKLGTKLRGAKDDQKKQALRSELRSTLDQLFEVREAGRKREIVMLEERIKKLRALAKKRRKHKSEVIEHQIKELSGELDYLKW